MEKMGENENETNLQIGSRVHFLLAVQFPDADTTDMLVRELRRMVVIVPIGSA